MPRSASTRLKDRSAFPGRHSNAASTRTPVLFRLPAIDPIALLAGLEELPASLRESKQETATQAHVSLPALPQKPAKEVDGMAPAEISASPMVAEKVLAQPEPSKSWWEHWSSGIVLILLVIALVTASIIAFSDTGGVSDLDSVADSEKTAANQFDLGNILVPAVEPVVVPEAASPKPEAALVEATPVPALPVIQTPLPASSTPQLSLENVDKAPPAIPTNFAELAAEPSSKLIVSVNRDSSDVGLIPGQLSLVAEQSSTPSTPATTTGTQPLQTKDTPATPTEQLVLSPASLPQLSAPKSGLVPLVEYSSPPGALASGSSQVLAPSPRTEANPLDLKADAKTLQATSTQAKGASPSFYDGASNTRASYLDTNLPSYEQLLMNQPQLPSSFSTASHVAGTGTNVSVIAHQTSSKPSVPSGFENPPPAVSSSLPVKNAGPIKSATPEMDANSIINAYQQFRQVNQAENASANRYSTSPNASVQAK